MRRGEKSDGALQLLGDARVVEIREQHDERAMLEQCPDADRGGRRIRLRRLHRELLERTAQAHHPRKSARRRAAREHPVRIHHDDRIGLMVYADRVLASCAPTRGLSGVMRLRRALEQLSVQAAESDPTAAAVSIRALLKHRALIVLLTDLDDASVAEQLKRAVRLLAPPHLVLVAGVHSGEIGALARAEAREWQDPWIALAAAEHEARAAAQRLLLQRLGAPVVAAPAEQLERAVFARYEALRRRRRV